MSSRRKNKHPKRAENAKTVVVASAAEEERVGEGEGEEERGPVLLCLRIPDDEQRNEIRKEKTTTTKGGKRKRGQHECDVCEKVCL